MTNKDELLPCPFPNCGGYIDMIPVYNGHAVYKCLDCKSSWDSDFLFNEFARKPSPNTPQSSEVDIDALNKAQIENANLLDGTELSTNQIHRVGWEDCFLYLHENGYLKTDADVKQTQINTR